MSTLDRAGSTAPRYMALAETLRARIAEGIPAVGGFLPTEHELCDTYDVSRHTVREALRLLSEEGLIKRKRGAGTQVIAREASPRFTQRLGGVDDLLQYAREARLTPLQASTGPLDPSVARALNVTVSGDFLHVHGVRSEPGGPAIALADVFIRADLAPPVQTYVEMGGAIIEWIAREKSVATARIEQSISAGELSETEAEALDAEPGEAALRTRRRYYDQGGRIVALSDTVHPADRFSYDMVVLSEVES